jgi:hypothetical protein
LFHQKDNNAFAALAALEDMDAEYGEQNGGNMDGKYLKLFFSRF